MRISTIEPKILLIKTVVGMEREALRSIAQRLAAPSRIMRAFGEFDLVAFIFDPATERLEWGSLPHVLGLREAKCILASGSDKTETQAFTHRLHRSPVVSACFIRLRTLPLQEAFLLEDRLLRHWEALSGESVAMRTFGHPGIVLLAPSSTIAHGSLLLQRLLAMPMAKNIAKTYSVIAYDPETASMCPPSDARVRYNFRINVACAPSRIHCLDQLFREGVASAISQDVEMMRKAICAGAHDFEISTPPVAEEHVPRLFEALCDLRHLHRAHVLHTATYFSHEHLVDDAHGPSINADHPGDSATLEAMLRQLSLTPTQARESFTLLSDFGPLAVRAIYAFQDVLRNDLLKSDVVDMYRTVLTIHEWLLEMLAYRHSDLPDWHSARPLRHAITRMRSTLDGIRLGLHQRTSASYLGAGAQESDVSSLVGGQQRLLQAAEAVPWSVWRQHMALKSSTTAWDGFVLFSPASEFVASGQVLHVPEHHKFKPQYWTTLVHEVAHGLCDGHVNFRIGSESEDSFSPAPLARGGSDTHRHGADSFVDECVADLLQAIYGPFWEPDLMLVGFWDAFGADFLGEYASGEWANRRAALCCRAYLVYCHCVTGLGLGPSGNHAPSYEAYKRAYSKILYSNRTAPSDRRLLSTALRLHPLVGQQVILSVWRRLRGLRDHVMRWCRIAPSFASDRRRQWDRMTERWVRELGDDRHVGLDVAPELLAWRLRRVSLYTRDGNVPFPIRAGAILRLQTWLRELLGADLSKAVADPGERR